MKEMLGNLANGQIEFYKAVRDLFLTSVIYSSSSRPWKNGIELYPSFNEYGWTFKYVYLLFLAFVYYRISYQLLLSITHFPTAFPP
jgi:hypothetical protein